MTTVNGTCVDHAGLLYRNTATASGLGPGLRPVEDTDPSHYCNPPAPAIDVETATNGIDADDPGAGDAPPIPIGDPVQWTYRLSNTGNVLLANVAVVDDQGVVVSCPQSTIDVGAEMTGDAAGRPPSATRQAAQPDTPEEEPGEYTSRLLAAKRRAARQPDEQGGDGADG